LKINFYIILLFLIILNTYGQKDPEYPEYLNTLFDEAYFFELSNPDSALVTYDIILQTPKNEKNYDFFIARANNKIGTILTEQGKYDSAIVYYNKSIKGYSKIGRKDRVAMNNICIGNAYSWKGEYSKAVPFYLNGIDKYEAIEDSCGLGGAYRSLGTLFEKTGRPESAKKNYFKASIYSKESNNLFELIRSYYKLSNLYLEENKIDSSFIFLNKAKQNLDKNTSDYLKHIISYGDAKYYLSIGESTKALINAKAAITYKNKNIDAFYRALTQSLIGKIYFEQGKLNYALKHSLIAAEMAKNYKNKETLINVYAQLSDIYKKMNNTDKVLYYNELESNIRDVVLNEKQREIINTLIIEYKIEKKDKEIIQQSLLLEQSKNEVQKKKIQNYFLIGLTLFFLIASILLFYIFRQRQKRKEKEIEVLKRENQIRTLESLIEGEEKERIRIAKELHDGVNGDLSAIKFKLSSLLELNTSEIEEAIKMIDNSCNQVRAISHNLIPPSLENFDLLDAVEVYCDKLNTSLKQKIIFQHFGDKISITKKEEINIFRIIQELVNNSIKHAEASEINVQISCRNKSMQITVEDNGKGFDKENVKENGIGLKNIQSRVDYLQANMDILSNSEGTSTTIEIDKT